MSDKEKNKNGRPSLYNNVEDLQKKIDEYFDKECGVNIIKDDDGKALLDKKGNPVFEIKPPTTCGLAYYLGYATRNSLYDLAKRNDDFSRTIKKALLRCEMFAEEQLYTNSHPVGAIFALKNRGWKDKQEILEKHNFTKDTKEWLDKIFDKANKKE